MSKIVVFTEEGFRGRTAEFTNDVRNLADKGFDKVISSIQVVGSPWVAYYEQNLTGEQRVFEAGDYPTLDKDKGQFSSVKMITDDLDNPKIQMFEHVNYEGGSVILRSETNLPEIGFHDTASSHKVNGGVWVLYEEENRQGRQLVSFPGEELPSYPAYINDAVSCVRPLLPKQ